MKKSLRKLIPAILMVLISASLMGTSTFAWFSLNAKVSVTGMKVTTKVGDSLQIASDTLDSTAKKDDSLFSNGLDQAVTGLLEPVSTINATSFFYTSTGNVKANGDANNDVYVAYDRTTDEGKNAFDQNYAFPYDDNDEDCVGYVDYVFQLKVVNTNGTDSNLEMSKVNLLYDYQSVGDNNYIKPFRIAIFVEDITGGAATAGVGALKTILRQSGAAYFTNGGEPATPKAVSATNVAPSVAVSNIDTATTLFSFSEVGNATKYFKVVVRMWMEGEDTACTTANFLELTKDYALDLTIELDTDNSKTAVTNIGSEANATLGLSGTTLTAALTNGETVSTYTFYKVGTAEAVQAASATATYTVAANGDYYCVITTTKGNTYRTPNVNYTAP